MQQRFLTVGVALMFGALSAAFAALPVYRSAQIVGPEGWHRSDAGALNQKGDVAGAFGPRGRGDREHQLPFFWSADAGLQTWPSVPSERYVTTTGLNDAGQVVGYSHNNGFVWTANAGLRRLSSRSGVVPFAINEAGVVTGMVENQGHVMRAMVWTHASGVVSIHPAGADGSRGLALNNRGEVAGVVRYEDGRQPFENAAVLSRGAEPRLLGCVSMGSDGTCFSEATGINDLGQVVGTSHADTDQAFIWSAATGLVPIATDLPADYRTNAVGINNRGQVLGYQTTAGYDDFEPFYWDAENGRHLLADLIAPDDPMHDVDLFWPRAINDRGQILLQTARNRTYLLTPEP